MKYLCAEDADTLRLWMVGIRIAKVHVIPVLLSCYHLKKGINKFCHLILYITFYFFSMESNFGITTEVSWKI